MACVPRLFPPHFRVLRIRAGGPGSLPLWFLAVAMNLAPPLEAEEDLQARDDSRRRNRVVFFSQSPRNPAPAQVSIEYGAKNPPGPVQDLAAQGARGDRVHLGNEDWTTLDTNVELKASKKTKVKPGLYALALERGREDEFWMVLLPMDQVRSKALDPGQPDPVAGEVKIALERSELDFDADSIRFGMGRDKRVNDLIHVTVYAGRTSYAADFEVEGTGGGSPMPSLEGRHRSSLVVSEQERSRLIASVEHGQPPWKSEYEERLEAFKKGDRWRLGQNFWTTLEVASELKLGGRKLRPGHYYLGLEALGKGALGLSILDPEKMRKGSMDPFLIDQARPSEIVPLKAEPLDESAEELDIRFVVDENAEKNARLVIRFGPHRLEAEAVL